MSKSLQEIDIFMKSYPFHGIESFFFTPNLSSTKNFNEIIISIWLHVIFFQIQFTKKYFLPNIFIIIYLKHIYTTIIYFWNLLVEYHTRLCTYTYIIYIFKLYLLKSWLSNVWSYLICCYLVLIIIRFAYKSVITLNLS